MKRAAYAIKDMTEKSVEIAKMMIRATPVMEILLGFIIAGFIYFLVFLFPKEKLV